MKKTNSTALFRLSVLGALVNWERLNHGELKSEPARLAARDSSPRLLQGSPAGQNHRKLVLRPQKQSIREIGGRSKLKSDHIVAYCLHARGCGLW